jgi:AcrR family transcriptional regulator
VQKKSARRPDSSLPAGRGAQAKQSASKKRPGAWGGKVQDRSMQFELKRQVVLRTAARTFSKRGFHQTTLADIAEELHIAKPTLYRYFESKDDILLEIQQVAIAQIADVVLEPDPAASGREQVEAFVRRYVEMIIDDFGACLIVTSVKSLLPENQAVVLQTSKRIEMQMREILRRGIADGTIAPCDPKIATMFLFGALNWIPHWYKSGGEIDPATLADRAVGFILMRLDAINAQA